MSLTRRDYKLLADGLKASKPQDVQCLRFWQSYVLRVASDLRATYSNFKKEQFLRGCGYYEAQESKESPGEWICQRCGENVPAALVTCRETHEGCGGECL